MLCVVGESGSGKSQTMFSIMGLLAGNGSVTNGSIKIDGEEIAPTHFDSRKKYEETMDRIRGNDMAMIFQDPMTFLNPTLRIETQLIEPIINHNPKISKKEARDKAIDLMRKEEFLHQNIEFVNILLNSLVGCVKESSLQSL